MLAIPGSLVLMIIIIFAKLLEVLVVVLEALQAVAFGASGLGQSMGVNTLWINLWCFLMCVGEDIEIFKHLTYLGSVTLCGKLVWPMVIWTCKE